MAGNTDIERDILLTISDEVLVGTHIYVKEGYKQMDWTHELINNLREFDQMELLHVSFHLMEALCNDRFDEAANILICNESQLEQTPNVVQVTDDLDGLCTSLAEVVHRINVIHQQTKAEFHDTNKVLLIYIDDDLDKNRVMRKKLWALYNTDDKLCRTDIAYSFPKGLEQFSIDEPVKKCYYFNQECAAQLLLKRIEFILYKYHQKQLSDFSEFDFMIYTARSNMLEKQTINRLCMETAECFHQDEYADLEKLEELARKKVKKYVITKTTKQDLEEMKADALKNPKKLLFIVADEAHWGISGQTNLGVSANNALVNAWDDGYPNVIVLLVTATPWNLLTQNSRIPWVTIAEKQENGEFLEVEKKRNRLVNPSTGSDVTNKVGPEKELHILRWTESCEDSFKRGLVIVFRVPQKESEPEMWLTVVERNRKFVLTITTNKQEATPLFLKMKNNIVTVETMERNGSNTKVLITRKENNEFFVQFVPVDCLASNDCSSYKLLMDFGEDIIELQPCLTDNIQLMYDSKKNLVCTGRRPAENKIDNFLVYHSLEYSFIVDSKYGIDLTEPGEQYLSLNFYYNTMRNKDPRKRLIRNDERFEAMARTISKNLGTTLIDDMLAAEYSYYIILVNVIRGAFARPLNFEEFLDNLRTCWYEYIRMKKEKLTNFEKELENCDLNGEAFKPISHMVFNDVAKYLQEESWKELLRVAKDLSKIKRVREDEYVDFVNCFVAYLMHADEDIENKMSEIKKLTLSHIPHLISQFSFSDEHEKTVLLTRNSETFRIVNDLINGRTSVNIKGRMKIIRVNDTAIGNRFYATLSLARKLGQDDGTYFFEIIRYFEKLKLYDQRNMNESCRRIWQELQRKRCESFTHEKTREMCQCESYVGGDKSIACMNCQHDHTNIKQFSDLNNLPCIVIVIEKARIGETFPKSFNCMDLRLRNRVQKPKLTSLMQELGRLCRYQEKCDYSEMPYALIGPAVEKSLREYLNKSAVFHSSYTNGNVDTYTSKSGSKHANDIMPSKQTKSRRQAAHQPNNKNYDSNNMDQHQNRLLLQAEPQIGKTGVFLKLISLLRLKIIGSHQEDSVEFDDDNDSESDQDINNNEILADNWSYPYWKDMRNDDSLKKVISNSKYSRLFGEYNYKIPPSYFNAGRKVKKGECKIKKMQISCTDDGQFRALSHIEHNHCLECKTDAPVSQYLVKMDQLEHMIKILVPSLKRYEPMTHILTKKDLTIDDTNPTDSRLKTWIFNPTYNRATDATINYFHAMASKDSSSQNQYIQILVVRPDDFNRYASLWQSTHAIIQMPDCLPGCDVDVNSGGIGFARRFIQLFAEHLKLDLIFMLDDNVYSICSPNPNVNDDHNYGEASSSNNSLDMSIKTISFFQALKHLEKLFDCKSDSPNFDFEKYDLNGSDMNCRKNNGLHTFTGSKGLYGIVGMLRYRPGSLRVRQPFRKTHVHSLVLVNIEALRGKSIAYKPWQVHEDLNINNECDEKNLTVCKFNRFVFSKKQLKSWMPSVYIWSEKDRLGSRKKRADASAKIILQWIRVTDPPKRLNIKCIEDNSLKEISHTELKEKLQLSSSIEQKEWPNLNELFTLLSGLMSVKAAKSHILALFNQNKLNNFVSVGETLMELIHEYFTTTEGIGAFTSHIVILETTVCFQLCLLKVEDFRKQLIEQVFEENSRLLLLTSHSIANFDVPFVIVYIEGTSESLHHSFFPL